LPSKIRAIVSDVFSKKLQLDKAAQLDVFGFVNDTPAATELLDDPVRRDGAADQDWASASRS
jgi:hypothetical protein